MKLANMRKPQEFCVSAVSDNEHCIIQSDKSIGYFSLKTGEGKLNTKGCYFPHLTFAQPYTLTEQDLASCRDALMKEGETMGYVGGSPVIFMGVKTL
jgi:hypothetical protein